jgi:hypothetical protein
MTPSEFDNLLSQTEELSTEQLLQLAQVIELTIEKRGVEKPHWGKSVVALLRELGPIELKYPEIEDPVEWVKHLRNEEYQRRLGGAWGEDEA